MAKILFTAFLADARGKLAGTVFSKNRSGAYTRTKVTPVNARTSYQMAVRQRLGSFSATWRGLTPEQRSLWNAAVANYPRTDQFGKTVQQTGAQLFIGLNSNLDNVGSTPIVTPPLPLEMPTISVDANYTGGVFNLSIDGTVPSSFSLVIKATTALSAGRNFVGNDLRQIAVYTAPFASPLVITSDYVNKFGAAPVGSLVGLQVYLISSTTGQAGVPLAINVIVS